MGTRSNSFKKAERIQRVWTLLGEGKQESEVVRILMIEWNCAQRSVYKYLEATRKKIKEDYERQGIQDLIQKYDFLYNEAIKDKDKRLAKSIMDSVGKFLHGEKHQIDGNINVTGIEINIKR